MKKTAISLIALTLCLLVAAIGLSSCGSADTKSALVGTWESVEAPGTSYTFNEDGKGTLNMDDDVTMNFTYTDKDSSVDLLYKGTSSAQGFSYTIEGNKLTMTSDEEGTVLTYTKK